MWLGANGLDKKNSELVLEDYEKMADELIAHFPKALIYVISPPPMTEKRAEKEEYPASPRRYENFERMLRKLAARRNFYYIDAYHIAVGEDGYMRSNYSIGDGFRLNRTALSILTDFIRTHTVLYPKTKEKPQ